MTLTALCTAHWPAIRSMTRDDSLLRLRFPLANRVVPSQRLSVWAEHELLPRLRTLPGLPAVSDPVLLAAGLLAYFAGRPLNATPPPPGLLGALETHLFDPAAGTVLPVKRTPESSGPKSKEIAPQKETVPPAQPWVDDLVERLLAVGCGWQRPSVHPTAATSENAPVVEERSEPAAAVPFGWDATWPGAELELIYLTVPKARSSLGLLAQFSPGVGHYLRAKWFANQRPLDQQQAEKHSELAIAIVHRFMRPCPDPAVKQNRFLYLEFWNPGQSGLPSWVGTMLKGSAQAGFQAKSFAMGQLFRELTAAYQRELAGKEKEDRTPGQIDEHDEMPDESVLRLALKEVAVHHCLNPECADTDKPQPALEEACKSCGKPFEPVFFSIPGILVTEEGWPFHEERDFVRCMMEKETSPAHYVAVRIDPKWVAILGLLAAESKDAEKGNVKRKDRGLTVNEPSKLISITPDKVGKILNDLVRQKVVTVSGKAPDGRYRLRDDRSGADRLFQPECPLHPDHDCFSQRKRKLWVQHLEGSEIPMEIHSDPLMDRLGDDYEGSEDDGNDPDASLFDLENGSMDHNDDEPLESYEEIQSTDSDSYSGDYK